MPDQRQSCEKLAWKFMRLSFWLKPHVVELGTMEVEGTEYPYVVIHRRGRQVPRWFVGYDRASGVYFISDEIRPGDRRPMLAHEMYEYGHLQQTGQRACTLAFQYELQHVISRSRPRYLGYLRFRLQTINALLRWADRQPSRVLRPGQRRGLTAVQDTIKRLQAA